MSIGSNEAACDPWLRTLKMLGWLLAMAMIALTSLGCDVVAPPDQEALRRKDPSSPWHVRDDFQVLVQLASKGDRPGVVRHLEKYLMVRSDFIAVFGDSTTPTRVVNSEHGKPFRRPATDTLHQNPGQAMWVGYRDVIAPKLRTEAADVIIKRVKSGMKFVEVERVGPVFPGRTTRGDNAMLAAMKKRLPMYTIRIRPEGEQLGLRFNGFVFVNGRWRALLKSYNFLPPSPPTGSPDPKTAPSK